MEPKDSLLSSLPPEWPADLLPAIRAERNRPLVVLDDDPTGTQTVAGLTVLTRWSPQSLAEELASGAGGFFVLTNSRALPVAQSHSLHRQIASNLSSAAQISGQGFTLVSRSDSTLRGHFPLEPQTLHDILGGFDAWILVPCFPEGGRLTVGDIHYVAAGDSLLPAAQTEFARDRTFGYHASNLKEWVEEKTGGAVKAGHVETISIEAIRAGGPEAVLEVLLDKGVRPRIIAVNAITYRDLEVLALACLRAEGRGMRILYRSAAALVRALLGQSARPLLTRADLALPSTPGLVIAGSYVPRTTAQLETLFQESLVSPVEIRVEALLEEAGRPGEISRAAAEVDRLLFSGRHAALYTSRRLVAAEGEAGLEIGSRVSSALVDVVRRMRARPGWIVAKGGITSSDIATAALGIQKAQVLGQILPGVPVWRAGPESRFEGLAYAIFPGNVGESNALTRVVKELKG